MSHKTSSAVVVLRASFIGSPSTPHTRNAMCRCDCGLILANAAYFQKIKIRAHCRKVMGGAGPACAGSTVGRLCHLEVIHACKVLDDAVACVIPVVHAEGDICLCFHGQVRLASSWPPGIYTPCCCVA